MIIDLKRKEQINLAARKYRKLNPTAVKATKKKYYEKPHNRIQRLALRACKRAKETGKEYDKEFICSLSKFPPKYCVCCNKELDYSLGKGNNRPLAPSLDRVENVKGYIRGNVEIICFSCNSKKSNSSLEQIEAIYKYMKENSNVCP